MIHSSVAPGFSVQGPREPLVARPGDEVLLPCSMDSAVPLQELEVEWLRTDQDTLVHLFSEGESRPESQDRSYRGRAELFPQEIPRGNFSLRLANVTAEDTGVYRCAVYTAQDSGQTTLELKEKKSLVVTGADRAVVSYPGGEVVLNCSVDTNVSLVKLEVQWMRTDSEVLVLLFSGGESRPESQHQSYRGRAELFLQEIHRGNFSLWLKDVRTEDKGQFVCRVFAENESAEATAELIELGSLEEVIMCVTVNLLRIVPLLAFLVSVPLWEYFKSHTPDTGVKAGIGLACASSLLSYLYGVFIQGYLTVLIVALSALLVCLTFQRICSAQNRCGAFCKKADGLIFSMLLDVLSLLVQNDVLDTLREYCRKVEAVIFSMLMFVLSLLYLASDLDTLRESLVVTGADRAVVSYPGGEVVLNCSVDTNVSLVKLEVQWLRTDSEVLVLLFSGGESRPESQHQSYRGRAELFLQEIHRGNFSLWLKDVRTEDKGQFVCRVFAENESAEATAELIELGSLEEVIMCVTVNLLRIVPILAFFNVALWEYFKSLSPDTGVRAGIGLACASSLISYLCGIYIQGYLTALIVVLSALVVCLIFQRICSSQNRCGAFCKKADGLIFSMLLDVLSLLVQNDVLDTLRESLVVTGADRAVVSYPGGEVVLNCSVDTHVPPEQLEVEWLRTDSEVLVLLFSEGESRPESQHQSYRDRAELFPQEIPRGNFSLRLKDVRTEDKGQFVCRVFGEHESAEATAELIELGLGPGLWDLLLLRLWQVKSWHCLRPQSFTYRLRAEDTVAGPSQAVADHWSRTLRHLAVLTNEAHGQRCSFKSTAQATWSSLVIVSQIPSGFLDLKWLPLRGYIPLWGSLEEVIMCVTVNLLRNVPVLSFFNVALWEYFKSHTPDTGVKAGIGLACASSLISSLCGIYIQGYLAALIVVLSALVVSLTLQRICSDRGLWGDFCQKAAVVIFSMLLFVLSLLYLASVLDTLRGFSVQGPKEPLVARPGGEVLLPCSVDSAVPLQELEVEWLRTDPDTLVLLFSEGESRPESQHQSYRGRAELFPQEIPRGNFSLMLANVTAEDSGVYRCAVHTAQGSGETTVELKEQERLVVTGADRAVVSYPGGEVVLSCSVDTNVPLQELEVEWVRTDPDTLVLLFSEGESRPESQHQSYRGRAELFPQEIPRGNFSLRLKDVRTEDKGEYMCRVHTDLGSANTTAELEQLRFSTAHIWILLLALSALGVVILTSVPTCQFLLKKRETRRGWRCCLVNCVTPGLLLSVAFILWGQTEGFLQESVTCATVSVLRILLVSMMAPYSHRYPARAQVGLYVLGSSVLPAVSAIALTAELILKAEKGRRTLTDLRLVVLPCQILLVVCWLVLLMYADYEEKKNSGDQLDCYLKTCHIIFSSSLLCHFFNMAGKELDCKVSFSHQS
ncbi:BTNL2 protein, partial [Atractosteus spatula]|nr:BTNL2 protein [Atractosteus spatula]